MCAGMCRARGRARRPQSPSSAVDASRSRKAARTSPAAGGATLARTHAMPRRTHALARPLTRTVVASVVHDADQARLFGDRLAAPRKVAALQTERTMLAVAAASAN